MRKPFSQNAILEKRGGIVSDITEVLWGRSILVTGGTGTFGQAFVRQALTSGAARVVVFSRDELKQSLMAAALADGRVRYMIGSVTDRDRVRRAMRGCDTVIHAAAMKQIPACEAHPCECVATNIGGTQTVALACIDEGVSRGIYLSTDKASEPNTHYGACKLAGERLWTQGNVYAAGRPTRLVATRYGNVLDSRGSVIPVWRAYAERGEPLPITDPLMTRFWMTIAHAVRLVCLALRYGRGGEVFVPRIPSALVTTLARAVAPDAPWEEIGIRRGEKLHESLISEHEARHTYDCGDHYRIEPERTWEHLPPLHYPLVPSGWSYRSDTNPARIDTDGLRALIAQGDV